jgi:hypothetical protein
MAVIPDPDSDISIIIGIGAALSDWDGLLIYIDMPKNEIQSDQKAGAQQTRECRNLPGPGICINNPISSTRLF